MEREVRISSGIDCDFDNGWCGWEQERLIDNLDWNLYTGSEHENFIGPAVDHTELSDSKCLSWMIRLAQFDPKYN